METEKKNGRGKKEVSLLGLFGKKFLEETQGKLAEATGISFFIIDYKGKIFDEMIRHYDKNYVNKYINEPRFNSSYSNSLVRMNILNGYFSKQSELDFGN